MITLKKHQIEPLMIQISGITPHGKEIGLLHEKITLGAKRIIKNVLKELVKEYEQYKRDLDEAVKAGNKEIEILNNEEIQIDNQRVDSKIIETIESETNYNFELLEKLMQ